MDEIIIENFNFNSLLDNNNIEYFDNLINYMINNEIFNTYITTKEDNSEFSIILKTKNSKKLKHLGKYQKIKEFDEIIDDTCSICFDTYKINQYKRKLNNCNHTFHKKCIDKWFKKNIDNMTCPICRHNYNKKIILDI